MSYTITQQATSPNAAYTRLIYTVSGSTKSSEPQFSYLVDVYESGSSSRVARLVQQVNPAGVSIFDPSRIFQGELSQDESWKISSVTPFNSSSKTFTLEFGEQYGTSVSSSITVSSSIATNNIEVFRGVVDPNAGYYNWDSASYAVLSNMPATMSMQPDDYGTVSLYNNTVVYVSQSFYSAGYFSGNPVLVDSQNYSITDNFSSVPISSSKGWQHVDVAISSSVGLQSYRYEVSNDTCREKVRFAFINKLGAWDYYNNYNPVRQSINVKREQYTAPRVDYSSLTSTYDISRRGLSDYHTNQARQKLFKYSITFTPSNQPFGKWVPDSTPLSGSVVKEPFDPTSGSALTGKLFAWYDWTDTDTMVLQVDAGAEIPVTIASKGTYTGSLYNNGTAGGRTLYNSGSGYVTQMGDNHYDMSGGGAEPWGETDKWDVFAGDASFTTIVVARAYARTGATEDPRVNFSTLGSLGNEGELRAKNLRMYGWRNEGVPFLSGSATDAYYPISNDITNTGISASYSQFQYTSESIGSPVTRFVYNYSGSTNEPAWETRVIRRSYSDETFNSGRVPSDFVTLTGVVNGPITADIGTGLTVFGGGALALAPNINVSGSINLSQILVYTGSLSDSEVNYVINSFMSSSNIDFGSQVNAVNN